ncbi:MAG: hypothetical protein CMI24_06145 [Opitutae bacterium]|nr:hypothetical protein [Opitutae bacterium]MEC8421326.1 hypothetical protein [Verrucomicrobiota bacterium]|tara:strand:- start:436 stop:1047 length:612 start_codon:yes stop_codon:yes gene_type:complete
MIPTRLIILSLIFILLSPIYARIGEERLELEKRLNVSGGLQYREERVLSNRRRGMPYQKYLDYLPERSEIRVYYKTLDGKKPVAKEMKASGMLEGWDVHIIFVEGKSVLEIYRRSSSINEFEFSALLRLQTGQSFWEKRDTNDENDETVTAFGFDYERNDKKLRAKKLGSNMMLICSAPFDKFIKQEFLDKQMESLPASIKGF